MRNWSKSDTYEDIFKRIDELRAKGAESEQQTE